MAVCSDFRRGANFPRALTEDKTRLLSIFGKEAIGFGPFFFFFPTTIKSFGTIATVLLVLAIQSVS